MKNNTSDAVNRPPHYTRGTIEVRDFVADQQLNFNRGSAVKYIVRAGFKDPSKEVEDLEKAICCLQHEVAMLRRDSTGVAERIIEQELEEIRRLGLSGSALAAAELAAMSPVPPVDYCLHIYVDGVCAECQTGRPRITVVEDGEP